MRITIIGAGFSGGVLATELMRHASQATELRLVGVADSFGRGVAYGEARAEHLLNVRARDLGADPDDPSGFVAWLNLGKRAEQGFLPRLAYGEYLYSRLQEALHASRADVRLHTQEEANAMVAAVHEWQQVFLRVLGRRMVFAADEYYLMAGLPFPPAEAYEGFHMHEDGIGMARTFELEFNGALSQPTGPQSGFFAAVDGAPAEGYRAPRNPAGDTGLRGCSTDQPNGAVSVRLGARPWGKAAEVAAGLRAD